MLMGCSKLPRNEKWSVSGITSVFYPLGLNYTRILVRREGWSVFTCVCTKAKCRRVDNVIVLRGEEKKSSSSV